MEPKIYYCPECDATLEEGIPFCGYCGSTINWTTKEVTKTLYETIQITDTEDDSYFEEGEYSEENTYPEYVKPMKIPKIVKGIAITPLLIVLMIVFAFSFLMFSGGDFGKYIEVESDIEMQEFDILVGTKLFYRSVTESYPDRRVTEEGMEYIQNILRNGSNQSLSAFDYVAVGTGDGELGYEYIRSQGVTIESELNAYTTTVVFAAGSFSGETITAVGIFNEAIGGIQLFHLTLTGITLQSGDSITIEVVITVGMI